MAVISSGNKPTLRQGSNGNDVKELQEFLGIEADGSFGPGTKAAVQKWQGAHGLEADGVVGPASWAAIRAADAGPGGAAVNQAATEAVHSMPGNTLPTAPAGPAPNMPTLHQGSSGDAVKVLQGYLQITADGSFGPQTAAAVEAYQKSHGLEADGVVGPQTWAAIKAGGAPTMQAAAIHAAAAVAQPKPVMLSNRSAAGAAQQQERTAAASGLKGKAKAAVGKVHAEAEKAIAKVKSAPLPARIIGGVGVGLAGLLGLRRLATKNE